MDGPTRRLMALLGALAVVAGVAGPANASAGSLDPTFAGDGIRNSIPRFGAGADLLVQWNDRILVADTRFDVARLRVNGRVDDTWGSGGVAKSPLGRVSSEAASEMVRDRDGRVVVVGTVSDEFVVVRFTLHGRPDTTFSGDGALRMSCGPRPFCGPPGVAIQPDGRIVIATWEGGFVLQRLNTDGTPDSTFGRNGVVSIREGQCCPIVRSSVLVDRDGTILAAGGGELARFTAHGRLVSTFGNHGIARLSSDLNPLEVSGLNIDEAGRILVVGDDDDWFVERFRPAGRLDRSFGMNGVRRVNLLGQDATDGMAVQSGGRIIVAGGTYDQSESGQFHPALVRLLPSGGIDRSFGSAGKIVMGRFVGFCDGVDIQAVSHPRIVIAGGQGGYAGGGSSPFAAAAFRTT